MPYLRIQTNAELDQSARKMLMKELSATIAEQLGKPERYVMVAIEAPTPMLFAGDDAPLAYVELKSIGLPETKTTQLSRVLCASLEEKLGIAGERVYIEFTDAERAMWGWNGATF